MSLVSRPNCKVQTTPPEALYFRKKKSESPRSWRASVPPVLPNTSTLPPASVATSATSSEPGVPNWRLQTVRLSESTLVINTSVLPLVAA